MDTIANFEQVLLKNLTANNRFLGLVSGILTEKSFANIANKEIYKIIKEYFITYSKAPNVPEIVASARNIPSSELKALIVDNLKVIVPLEPILNEEFLVKETIAFIKNGMITDALIVGADGIAKNSEELKMKAYSMMEEAQKIRIDTDLGLDFDDIKKRIEYYQQKLLGHLTLHADLDKRLGAGFLPKTLSVIAAPPGIGKSLLLTDLGTSFLLQGKNILLITLEMSDFETVKRIDANALDLPINDLRNLDESVILAKHTALKDLGKLFTKEYAPGTFSSLMLKGLLDSYRIEKGVVFDIILIDYLGLMKSDRVAPSIGSYGYLKSITEEVRSVAVIEGIPIISPAQLNRSAINQEDADNSSMAESAGILQTADFIVLLLQTTEMKERNEIIFKVTKNRFTGITDSWVMGIDYTRMRFKTLVISSNGPTKGLSPEAEKALTFNENTGTLNNVTAMNDFDFSDI
jgi:replicative DNA helicase